MSSYSPGVHFAGVLCGRATWQDGIPVHSEQGFRVFGDWLSDRGVRNIKVLDEVLRGTKAWHSKYGGMEKIQKVS
jgi:tagatose 1,6-diphosphate aldolase